MSTPHPVQDRMLTREEFLDLMVWDSQHIRSKRHRWTWFDSTVRACNRWFSLGDIAAVYRDPATGRLWWMMWGSTSPPLRLCRPTVAGGAKLELFGWYTGPEL